MTSQAAANSERVAFHSFDWRRPMIRFMVCHSALPLGYERQASHERPWTVIYGGTGR